MNIFLMLILIPVFVTVYCHHIQGRSQ